MAENRKDRRKLANQSGKRQSLVIVRERNGDSVPAVFKSESAATPWINTRIAKATLVNADESGAWNDLGSKYELLRINHQEAYSMDGACTNMAESYFYVLQKSVMSADPRTTASPKHNSRQVFWWLIFFLMPRSDPHDVDGVADNIGGALLALGSFRHRVSFVPVGRYREAASRANPRTIGQFRIIRP